MARLPVYSVGGQMLGDQLEVGLFYVTDARGQHDPRVPEAARPARLGNAIELLGFSLPPCAGAAERPGICVRLHWQSIAPAERNYTAFVQLLDAGGGYVTGYDAQPLNGLYPTSRWQPGEVIVSDFRLALPASHAGGRHPRFRGDGPAAGYRLVTGLYDLTTGERLPVTTVDGVATGDVVTLVSDLQLPE
jgi:hypothetical protein